VRDRGQKTTVLQKQPDRKDQHDDTGSLDAADLMGVGIGANVICAVTRNETAGRDSHISARVSVLLNLAAPG
jgi:hypothetical protein